MVEVTQADREAAAKWAKMQGRPHQAGNMRRGACDAAPLVQAFAHHRIAAFADGFSAALQGAEALTWGIEDDSFLYESVSEALQEVISELQAMERNWTGRATVDHRIAAEQRGKLEGARLAIEAAATVAPSKTPSGECETVGQWTRRTLREAIRALDPAKIVGEG